ncbi:MAG: tetratricopeptide repeat protein, partial [Planctomycetota bacterium]
MSDEQDQTAPTAAFVLRHEFVLHQIKQKAEMLRQEHRLFKILKGYFVDRKKFEHDQLREAVEYAFWWRVTLALFPSVVATGIGITAMIGLYISWQANLLLEQQNSLLTQSSTNETKQWSEEFRLISERNTQLKKQTDLLNAQIDQLEEKHARLTAATSDERLSAAYELLFGEDGYFKSKDKSKLRQAEALVRQVSQLVPDGARVIEYQGHLKYAIGNRPEARKLYLESLQKDPDRGSAYNSLGAVSVGTEAIDYFEKAIEIGWDKVDLAYQNLNNLYSRSKSDDKAESYYRKAIELHPSDHLTHLSLARLFLRTNRHEEARKAFEKAIEYNPTSVDSFVELGKFMMSQGDQENGKALIEHAARLDPKDDYAYAMLAAIY